MAMNKGFKLTENQKFAAYTLHTYGNVHNHNWNTVQSLINKGLMETFESDTIMNRFDLVRFTTEGQAWADVQFGSSEPTPPVTPDTAPSEQETVAGESVADSDTESPVARFQVFNNVIDSDPMSFDEETDVVEHLREYEADGENLRGYLVVEHTVARAFYLQNLVESINAETWLSEHAPVSADTVDPDDLLAASRAGWGERTASLIADSEIPFASFDSPCITEPPVNPVWTHKLPVAEIAPRYQKTPKTAHKRDLPRPVVQLANMERRKAPMPKKRANKPIVAIPQLTRFLETKGRAA